MKKLLLLDIDDTICNFTEASNMALDRCYDFLRKKYPLVDKKLFFHVYAQARRQIHLELGGTASMHNRFLYFQRLFELFGLMLDPRLLDDITELFWQESYRHLRLYKHVADSIQKIKESNMKIGIVSDLVAHIQIKKLNRLKIAKYIDFIVTSEECGKEKPHPSIFLLALKKAGCLPEEAVMLGDSVEKDIRGANYLGMTSVFISRGQKHTECKDAAFTIHDFQNIVTILDIKKRKTTSKKCVVFDFFGVLCEENNIIRKILYPLIEKKGINITYPVLREWYTSYSSGKIKQEDFRKIVPEKLEKEFLDSIEYNKEIVPVITQLLSKGYLLGILSNFPKEWGEYLIQKFGLQQHFSVIIFSGQYGANKPDERLYEIFIEQAKVQTENCYFIDDKLKNLKEGRFLLMKTIWMKKEEPTELFIPDYVVENPKELLKIFNV